MEISKKKIWRHGLGIGIITVCFLLSSIPALAYRGYRRVQDKEGVFEKESWNTTTAFVFVPTGEEGEFEIKITDFSQGDCIFIDETGKIYPVEDFQSDSQVRAACTHNYEAGNVQRHNAKRDGSCEVIIYNAQRCTKCGNTITGLEVSRQTFASCPH